MAVDSAAKRRSLISLGRPWTPRTASVDGTVDQADKKTLLFRYAGDFTAVVPEFVRYSGRVLTGDNYGGRLV